MLSESPSTTTGLAKAVSSQDLKKESSRVDVDYFVRKLGVEGGRRGNGEDGGSGEGSVRSYGSTAQAMSPR